MKVYVIAGKARSGKSTFGNMLKEKLLEKGYKPCIMQITYPLYHYAEDYFSYNKEKDPKPREFLQEVGVELIKNKLNKKRFLIDRLEEDIEILSNYFDTFIITDARFKTETDDFIKKYNATVIKIEREFINDLTDKQKMHTTEISTEEIDNYKYLFKNVKLDQLDELLENMINKEEDTI